MLDEIISRRNSVKRVALGSGYPEYRAEDIAQDAVLALIENKNLISQSPRQAYVDSLRGGSEAVYTRAGYFTQPVYESSFEDYSSFINAVRSEYDIECEQIVRSHLFDIVSALEVLKPSYRVIWEMHYVDGTTMDQISQQRGLSPSRITQIIKLSNIKIKEAVISARLSQQEERRRKFEESREIPRKIQRLARIQRTTARQLETISSRQGFRVVSFKVPKIPKNLFVSF